MKKKKVTYPTFVEDNKKYMLCKHCQVEYVQVDEGEYLQHNNIPKGTSTISSNKH